jgi:soluble P-type ATPase
MIKIEIPGFGAVALRYAVFDYNGTLALDGKMEEETLQLLEKLQDKLEVHILTADTFGLVQETLRNYRFNIHILQGQEEAEQKAAYVEKLGTKQTIAFGNGNNDVQLLKKVRVGVAVIGEEGGSSDALSAADLVVKDIGQGIELLFQPLRLKAGLRF